ncbi:hypothetical protein GCM10023172_00270 [Hymenobacter ginsengisoli]|uniref:GAF domain-containing protein n=1 Tax=Hymenobacter ginsengisoli TaxID=1051626 RepID=A0ABP8PT23_9BACT|nr:MULTISPECIES: GAF domain-containing protein [unclassified Hymenobacter]MBO2033753.1 GAF domain-containing protein [Hymenobacter sp. BT559]
MFTTPASLLPADEPELLRSLRAYDVLPLLIEPVFEEFVALTAQVFSLPISLIAVVEEEQVLYPANRGLPAHKRQRRVEALCSSAIQKAHAVVYHDLLLETSSTLTPEAIHAAERNELRFYAGALLRLPDQQPLGTLCIIDRQPRPFSAEEQQVLDHLAALVSQALAVRLTHAEQWEQLHALLKGELRELTALVRYLFTRYGIQIPVPGDLLAQVERRLLDLHSLLSDQFS